MDGETQEEPNHMFKQLRGNQAQQGATTQDLAWVNFPSRGFPVPFLDVSIYQRFPGSWFKAINSAEKESLTQYLGLAAKLSRAAEWYWTQSMASMTEVSVISPWWKETELRRLALKNPP